MEDTTKQITVRFPAQHVELLDGYRESQKFNPARSDVLRLALENFLVKEGYIVEAEL